MATCDHVINLNQDFHDFEVMQKSPEHDVGQETPETKQSTVKERAIEFYKDKNVPGALEKLLNVMFLDAPDDAYGYMVG